MKRTFEIKIKIQTYIFLEIKRIILKGVFFFERQVRLGQRA